MTIQDILTDYKDKLEKHQEHLQLRQDIVQRIQEELNRLNQPGVFSLRKWLGSVFLRRYMWWWQSDPYYQQMGDELTNIVQSLEGGDIGPALSDVQGKMKHLKEKQRANGTVYIHREELFGLDEIQRTLLENAHEDYQVILPVDLLPEKKVRRIKAMFTWGWILLYLGLFTFLPSSLMLLVYSAEHHDEVSTKIVLALGIGIFLMFAGIFVADCWKKCPPEQWSAYGWRDEL